jgi:hypothetical protein
MMAKPVVQVEGTWEEILARSPELAGRRVRLTVLDTGESPAKPEKVEKPEKPPVMRPASGRDVFETAVGWAGDDFEECLQIVYNTRSKARFGLSFDDPPK